MTSRKKLIAAGVVAISLAAAALVFTAVQDKSFELDGNIVVNTTGKVDWASLYDVSGSAVPTPKASLPTGFGPASFVRDFNAGATNDPTTYTTGSKDTLNIGGGGWQCVPSNNVTDKGDILNSYATAFIDNTTTPGHTIIYFAMEISSNEGTKDVGFWFLKDKTVGCVSGKKATDFTGNHTDGDLLIVSEYTKGGGVSTIKAYAWSGGASGSLVGPIATGADCQTTGGGNVCATVNSTSNGPLLASNGGVPWLTQTKTSNPSVPGLTSADLDVGELFEGGIDLTASGLSGCFTQFLADTRSAATPNATLYDYSLGSFPLCDLSVGKTCDTGTANNPKVLTDGITLETTFKVPISSSRAGTINNVTLAETPQPGLVTGESCRITAIESKTGAIPATLTLPYTLSGTTAVKVYNSLAGFTTANVTIVCDTLGRNPFIDTVTATSTDVADPKTHTTGSGETCPFTGNPTVVPTKCCNNVTVDPDTLVATVCVDITVTNNSNPPEDLINVTVKDGIQGAAGVPVDGLTNISLDASGAGATKKVTSCYTTTHADQVGNPLATSQLTFSDHLTSVTATGAVDGIVYNVPAASLPSATCPLCGNGNCPVQ